MATQDYSVKGVFWYLVNGVLVVTTVFGLIGIGTMVRYSNAIAPTRTIQVSGEGKLDTRPDIATITASVITRGADAAKVQQDGTTKMNSVIAFVKAQGVKEQDIQTTSYNVYPTNRWDPKSGEQILTGYEASQSITIKVRGIDKSTDKVNAIAGGIVPAGANQVSGVQYMIENPEVQRAAARAQAFDNAAMKAREMAKQNGVRIARVITFSESNSYGGPIYYDRAMVAGKAGEVAPMPTIEPGTEEVRVSVSVTYEIR